MRRNAAVQLESLPPLTRARAPSTNAGFGARATTNTRSANRYAGAACPPGQSVVRRVREPRAPRFAGDKTYDEFVYCQPIAPIATPAPARAPEQRTQITVSPVVQTAVNPQISPVFQQVQDSPGASQGASTTQVSPGGQTATGGGSGNSASELIEFLRLQSEADARRREEERALYNEQIRRQNEERARIAAEEQAARDRANQERAERQAVIDAENARRQAEYERQVADWQRQTPPASTFTSTVIPSASAPESLPVPATGPNEQPKPFPWIIVAGVALAAGVYWYSQK